MNPLIKKILIALAIIIVIAIGYRMFFPSSTPATTLTNTTQTSSDSQSVSVGGDQVSQQLLSTLLSLKTIKLDDQIFNNPLFSSLSDFTITLGTGVEGRVNPFAPIGTDPAVVNNNPIPNANNSTDISNNPVDTTSVKTVLATNITKNSATLNGAIISNTDPFSAWFEWNKVGATTPATKTTVVSFAGSVTAFSAPVSGLIPGTAYTFKAFVKMGNITLSGASDAFTTPAN